MVPLPPPVSYYETGLPSHVTSAKYNFSLRAFLFCLTVYGKRPLDTPTFRFPLCPAPADDATARRRSVDSDTAWQKNKSDGAITRTVELAGILIKRRLFSIDEPLHLADFLARRRLMMLPLLVSIHTNRGHLFIFRQPDLASNGLIVNHPQDAGTPPLA